MFNKKLFVFLFYLLEGYIYKKLWTVVIVFEGKLYFYTFIFKYKDMFTIKL